MKYLNFDLLIRSVGEIYEGRVLNSPGGQTKPVRFDFASAIELEDYMVSAALPPDISAAKSFGLQLFNTVFTGELHSCLSASMHIAKREASGLRIRLHVGDVPRIAALPWEYLYDPEHDSFLALSIRTPVVRFETFNQPIVPVFVKPPLRVLAMIATPEGYPLLDAGQKAQELQNALSDLRPSESVSLELLDGATATSLYQRLREREYHVFHFIGHSGFNEQAQEEFLVMADARGRANHVSAETLSELLYTQQKINLAVLDCATSARGLIKPFAGMAHRLMEAGVETVIGIQFDISDKAAIAFPRELYTSLASGHPIDEAVSNARVAMLDEASGLEWGALAHYSRSASGRIFELSPAVALRGPEKGMTDETDISVDESPELHINLWIEDEEQVPLNLPAPMSIGKLYQFLIAIEGISRDRQGLSEPFIVPEGLRNAPVSRVIIEVLCPFLDPDGKIGCVRREVFYYAGIGIPKESFALRAAAVGRFNLTARLILNGETVFREVLPIEVAPVLPAIDSKVGERISAVSR
jgi:hypothetical protein